MTDTRDNPTIGTETARLKKPAAPSSLVLDIIAGISDSTHEVGEAIGIPPEAYISEEFFDFERSAIFERSWLYLCHVSELTPSSNSLSAVLLGEPVLVTRGQDGTINVMSAVCQHRGHTLCERDVTDRHVRCPYHSWTYALDGKLVGAPSMTPEWEVRQLRKNIRLPQLRAEVWHGLVFVNFDPDATPLNESLERLDSVIGSHGFENLVAARAVELGTLSYNWKNMLENALEEYHTTYVHAGFHDNAPPELVRHGEYEPGDGGVYRHAGLVIKGGEDVPGRPTFPVIEGMPDSERGHLIFFAVPPSFFAVVYPHGLKVFRVLARSAGEISMRITFLFPQSTLELPNFPEMLAKQVDLVELLDQPDIDTNTHVFQGMRSRYAPRGPLGPQERTLPQLYHWLAERCEEGLRRSQ